jgi:polyisoprenoid-binding protein YceI
MKKILLMAALFTSIIVHSQKYTLNTKTAQIGFQFKHVATKVNAHFADFEGSYETGKAFNIIIQTASARVNDQINAPDFAAERNFNAAAHPLIELKSTTVSQQGNTIQFNGTISIKGVSKEVSFPINIKPNYGGFDFDLTFTIDRKDFNIGNESLSKSFIFTVKGYCKKTS